ncbi:MAG: hypothetical protein AAFZ11_09630 [Pseudomonadota bacterium]
MITLNAISKGFTGLVGLAALATMSAPAAAQEVYEEPIELKNLQKGKVTLKQDKGYIFFDAAERTSLLFFRTPLEEDVRAYEAAWEEALVKAQEKYERHLRAYEAKAKRGNRVPDKPVEPTRETFSISDIETKLMVTVGPQYVFDKGKSADGTRFYQYLEEVEPGEYTYYGAIMFTDQGTLGACKCMGTFKFEVKAGEITSLGDFLNMSWADDAAMRKATPFWPDMPERVLKPTDWSIPESLNALPAAQAELHAVGKLNNFYRVIVSRMPEIDGVLRYERDTVIDVRAEIAAAEEAEALAKAEAEAEAAAAAAAAAQAQAEAEGEGETAAEVAEASEVEEEASSAPAPATEP